VTERRPRVALVAHRLGEAHPSGIGRYYRELVVALAATAKLDLVVGTPRELAGAGSWLPAGVTRATAPGNRRLLQLVWSLAQRPLIDGWIGDAALVHALHTWAPTPTRRPLVVTVHDMTPVVRPEFYRADHRWALRRGISHAAGEAELLIAVSEWTASLLRERAGVEQARIRVVPNGVTDGFRVAGADGARVDAVTRRFGVERGRYVFALGQLTPRKNLTTVIRAIARVAPDRLGEPALVLAGGPGPDAAVIAALVDELGLGPRVRLAGFVDDSDAAALVAGALALAHPSADEGFGLTPLEAMAAGTATIVSRAASLPEVVGDAALLVDPDDVDGWAAAIDLVATDVATRERLIEAGRARQAQFTWAETAVRTLAVYDEVLASAGGK
jgi:glycosyltransferase involved in cell wall biosynthesis